MEIIFGNLMKEKIISSLERIEWEHGVRILYAIESGSRMWGFASENSDYDIRFIYVGRPDYYLSVSKKNDYINYMDKDNDLDFSGWDLQKALGLLWKSNMSLYEWLRSPIIYRDSPEIHSFRRMANDFWDRKSLIYSYIHLARHNYKAYIEGRSPVKIKKYLYILRTIAACIYTEQNNDVPPILVQDLLPVLEHNDEYIGSFMRTIVDRKKSGEELSSSTPDMRANEWIERQLEYYFSLAESMPQKERDITVLDRFLCETVLKFFGEL